MQHVIELSAKYFDFFNKKITKFSLGFKLRFALTENRSISLSNTLGNVFGWFGNNVYVLCVCLKPRNMIKTTSAFLQKFLYCALDLLFDSMHIKLLEEDKINKILVLSVF